MQDIYLKDRQDNSILGVLHINNGYVGFSDVADQVEKLRTAWKNSNSEQTLTEYIAKELPSNWYASIDMEVTLDEIYI